MNGEVPRLRFRKDGAPVVRDPPVMQAADVLTTLVSDVLAAGDAPARVFLARHMGCVGCPFAAFETVAEAAASYGTDPCELAESLLEAVATSAKGSPS